MSVWAVFQTREVCRVRGSSQRVSTHWPGSEFKAQRRKKKADPHACFLEPTGMEWFWYDRLAETKRTSEARIMVSSVSPPNKPSVMTVQPSPASSSMSMHVAAAKENMNGLCTSQSGSAYLPINHIQKIGDSLLIDCHPHLRNPTLMIQMICPHLTVITGLLTRICTVCINAVGTFCIWHYIEKVVAARHRSPKVMLFILDSSCPFFLMRCDYYTNISLFISDFVIRNHQKHLFDLDIHRVTACHG